MPTIIALWGVGNSGKTTTIRRVFDELQRTYPLWHPGRMTRKEVLGAILEIDGVRVGFYSQGDLGAHLLKGIPPLIKDCAVIVCATRSAGGSVRALNQLASESEIDWVEKDRQEQADHDSGNRRKAAEIIAKVLSAVASAKPVAA